MGFIEVFTSEMMLGILNWCDSDTYLSLMKTHPTISATMKSHGYVARRMQYFEDGLGNLASKKNSSGILFYLEKVRDLPSPGLFSLVKELRICSDPSFRNKILLELKSISRDKSVMLVLMAAGIHWEDFDICAMLLGTNPDHESLATALYFACVLNSADAWGFIFRTYNPQPEVMCRCMQMVHNYTIQPALQTKPNLKAPVTFLKETLGQFYNVLTAPVLKQLPELSTSLVDCR